MSQHSYTVHYEDKPDLIRQLDELLTKLLERQFEPYEKVRDRYGLKTSAFCMRLRRFLRSGGQFPHTTGAKGKRIITLVVTPALDLHLRK